MTTIQVNATIETDGELRLTDLPCRRGDKVEAVVRLLTPATSSETDDSREAARAAALDEFLKLARASSFRSTGPYPTRDELHDRD